MWPDSKRKAGDGPLSLRLIEIETPRADVPNVFLVTHLSAKELTDEQAAALYALRWGVEVVFRTVKQTLEGRVLRSRTPGRALAEAEWLVLSLWLLGALAVPAVRTRRKAASGWSPAASVKVVRRRMRHAHRSGGAWNKRLKSDLAACVIDRRPRHSPKQRFRHPRKKITRPPNPPEVRPATHEERLRYRQITAETHPLRLTA